MHRTTLYVAAVLSGVAAAYLINEWVLYWWSDTPRDDPPEPAPDPSKPAPLPNGHTLAIHPDAMTSSTSLHTLSSIDEQESITDTDTEPFVDVLSPPPTHAISRRRSLRNHDLFAASHISFSELGSLVAPKNELH